MSDGVGQLDNSLSLMQSNVLEPLQVDHGDGSASAESGAKTNEGRTLMLPQQALTVVDKM